MEVMSCHYTWVLTLENGIHANFISLKYAIESCSDALLNPELNPDDLSPRVIDR